MFKYNTKKILNAAHVLIPALFISPVALSADYPIISGTFFMAKVSSKITPLVPGTSTGVLTENTFQGTANTADNHALFEPFTFFGYPVGTYTAQTGVDNLTHTAPAIATDINGVPTGLANMGAFYAYWNGTEFNQGHISATVTEDSPNPTDDTPRYKISWDSLIVGGPFDGKTGSWTMIVECTACPKTPPFPAVTLSAEQTEQTTNPGPVITRTVTMDDGLVTVSLTPSLGAGYTYDWSFTSDVLDGGNTVTTSTFSFDPSVVAEGTYAVAVRVLNTNITPNQLSKASLILHVVPSGDLNALGDSDNDGIANSADDAGITATQLQGITSNNTTYLLSTSAGELIAGNVAACAGTNAAAVTLNQIKNNATNLLVNGEYQACNAANATDNTFAVTTGIGGYFDFKVRGLQLRDQIQVVIPLQTTLPKNAGIRVFNSNNSPAWGSFDTKSDQNNATPTVTELDSVASASSTSAGVCPAANSSSWQAGLKEGDDCIRITITDKGTNDTDNALNGMISMTGTIEGYPGIGTDLQDDGCSMTGNTGSARNHLEWLLVAMFIAALGMFRKQKV